AQLSIGQVLIGRATASHKPFGEFANIPLDTLWPWRSGLSAGVGTIGGLSGGFAPDNLPLFQGTRRDELSEGGTLLLFISLSPWLRANRGCCEITEALDLTVAFGEHLSKDAGCTGEIAPPWTFRTQPPTGAPAGLNGRPAARSVLYWPVRSPSHGRR